MSCLSLSGFMYTGTDVSLYLRYSFVRNGVAHNASQRMRFAPLFSSRSSLKNIFGLPALFRVMSLAPHWERFDTFLIPVWKAGVSVGGIYKITMKMNVTGDFVTILCWIRFYFLESQWKFAMGAVAWFSQAVDCRVNEDSCSFPWLVGLPRRDLCETGAVVPQGQEMLARPLWVHTRLCPPLLVSPFFGLHHRNFSAVFSLPAFLEVLGDKDGFPELGEYGEFGMESQLSVILDRFFSSESHYPTL